MPDLDSQCGDFLEKYKNRLLANIDARAIAQKLVVEEVIPDSVYNTIDNSALAEANGILFVHLQTNPSPETLHKLCDVMSSMNGYNDMMNLGRNMKECLFSVGYIAESN